ncbi:MAG: hypothetical protein ACK56I_08925, partial [bacterium]
QDERLLLLAAVHLERRVEETGLRARGHDVQDDRAQRAVALLADEVDAHVGRAALHREDVLAGIVHLDRDLPRAAEVDAAGVHAVLLPAEARLRQRGLGAH